MYRNGATTNVDVSTNVLVEPHFTSDLDRRFTVGVVRYRGTCVVVVRVGVAKQVVVVVNNV